MPNSEPHHFQYFSSPEILDEVYGLLKDIRKNEDCEFHIEFKTDTRYYNQRGKSPSWCHIVPIYNNSRSQLAINDYAEHISLGFFHTDSQIKIKRLNEIFSIGEQRAKELIYSDPAQSFIHLLFSFKQEPVSSAQKGKNYTFKDAVEKSFKKSNRQDPLYTITQRYILDKSLQDITKAQKQKNAISPNYISTEKEASPKTFKI